MDANVSTVVGVIGLSRELMQQRLALTPPTVADSLAACHAHRCSFAILAAHPRSDRLTNPYHSICRWGGGDSQATETEGYCAAADFSLHATDEMGDDLKHQTQSLPTFPSRQKQEGKLSMFVVHSQSGAVLERCEGVCGQCEPSAGLNQPSRDLGSLKACKKSFRQNEKENECTELQAIGESGKATEFRSTSQILQIVQDSIRSRPSDCPDHSDGSLAAQRAALLRSHQDAILSVPTQHLELQLASVATAAPSATCLKAGPCRQEDTSYLLHPTEVMHQAGNAKSAPETRCNHGQTSDMHKQPRKRKLKTNHLQARATVQKVRAAGPPDDPSQNNSSLCDRPVFGGSEAHACRSPPLARVTGSPNALQADAIFYSQKPVHAIAAGESTPHPHTTSAGQTSFTPSTQEVPQYHTISSMAAHMIPQSPESKRIRAAWFTSSLWKTAGVRHAYMTEAARQAAQLHHAELTSHELQQCLGPGPVYGRGPLGQCKGTVHQSACLCCCGI